MLIEKIIEMFIKIKVQYIEKLIDKIYGIQK